MSRKGSSFLSGKILRGKSIGVLLSNTRDRALLVDFLMESGAWVIGYSAADPFPLKADESFDAIICDSRCAAKWHDELLDMKRRDAVFLPLIVTVSRDRAARAWIEAGFDEVFISPVAKNLLLVRLSHLLRLREQSKEILQKGELLFRTLIEQSLVGIALIRNHDFYYVNDKFARMIGLSAETIRREYRFLDVVCDEDCDGIKEGFDALYGLKLPYYQDVVRCENKDGHVIHCEVLARLIEYRNEQMIFAVFVDITAEKKLEEQLLTAQKMTAIGKLAGGIAHDFNNLLTIILGNSELLLASDGMDDRATAEIEEIKGAAERGAALTEKLLILSRRRFSQPKIVSINDILTEFQRMLSRTLGEDIELVLELDRKVGKAKIDPSSFEQVALNMALNAREAMPDGGKLIIRTRCYDEMNESEALFSRGERKPGKYSVVIFEDTGKGMDAETKKHIFDPFFTTRGDGKGTGLGLSIVYSLVEQMDGWIDVYSEPGKGTVFSIFIPQTEESSVESAVIDGGELGDGELAGKGERILLVEDEELVREYIANILRQNGYRVVDASTSREALEIFRSKKGGFDVIVSDVVLPDMNGLELVKELEKLSRDLKVIFVSGYSDERSRWETIVNSGYRFIQKPFHLRELLKAIRMLIVRESV